MNGADMTRRKVREPRLSGERYREARERRARDSRARREAFWAGRVAAAQTPLAAFRVFADRVSTAVVQRERRAVVASARASADKPGSRQATAARTRLDRVRAEITADLVWLSQQMLDIAARHETHRV